MKILSVDACQHRLFNDENLSNQLKTLALSFYNINSDMHDLLSCSDEKLRTLLLVMLDRNGVKFFQNKKYQKRITYEIKQILSHEEEYMLDFFLIWEDIAFFFESQDLIANIGRGQAASSLINYALGITKVDPIRENLLFENWFNRTKTPDIDFDCGDKEELVSYLKGKYGASYQQLKVQTYHKLIPTLKDILLSEGMKYAKAEMIIDLVKEFPFKKESNNELALLTELIKNEPLFSSFLLNNPRINSKLFKTVGSAKGLINHASGFILSSEQDVLDYQVLEANGIVKLDILTSQVYKSLNKYSSLSKIKKINPTKENFNKILTSKDSIPGFLASSIEVYKSAFNDEPVINSALDAAIILAKARPSAIIYLDTNKNYIINDPRVTQHLSETNGDLIFQEQALLIISDCLNVDLFEAKRIFREMSASNSSFVTKKSEYAERIGLHGEAIINFLHYSSMYLFSKAHAMSYAYLELYCRNVKGRPLVAAS